jgi:hypothetical protein
MSALGEQESSAQAEFDAHVDHLMQKTCEVTRALVGAHQAAMALLVAGDWTQRAKPLPLRQVRALEGLHDAGTRNQQPAPAAPMEAAAGFVVIESV